MSSISVWVLVLYIGKYNQGGPAVIDNIASRSECLRVAEALDQLVVRCVEVRKVMP
jgi:hypothetical protein